MPIWAVKSKNSSRWTTEALTLQGDWNTSPQALTAGAAEPLTLPPNAWSVSRGGHDIFWKE